MNRTCENNRSLAVQEIRSQISALEDLFVELFVAGVSRALLKHIHVQLQELKMQLQLQGGSGLP